MHDSSSQPAATRDPQRPAIFIVFGMPRTGTTWLYHALPRHPDIFVPYRKESHYFSVNYCKGEAWFRSLYADMAPGQIGADINPMYYLDAQAVERIVDYDPAVKIVLGVREPVDFARSLYGNMLAHGLAVPSIVEMVRGFDWPVTPHTSLPFVLAGGFMQRRIGELRARFGSRLLMYDFRFLDASPLAVLTRITDFLGLAPWFDESTIERLRINASGRRDPGGLNALFANQRVLDLLYACLPRPAIRHARRWYERFSARAAGGGEAGPPSLAPGEQAALEALLADDVAFYRALFAHRSIVCGTDDDPSPSATPALQA